MEAMDEVKAALGELTKAAATVNDLKGRADTLEARIDTERKEREEMELRMNRDRWHGGRAPATEVAVAAEHKAIASFIRTGDETGFAEVKSLARVGSDPDGGYLVTPALSQTIQRRVFDASPIARLARRVTIDTGDAFEEPIDDSDIGAEWVTETAPRPGLQTPKLRLLRVPCHEIYTNQTVTQRLLDDSRFEVGSWITDKIADKFARSEGAAFISGDGTNKPQGILAYPTSTDDDGTRDWFTIQHINTGANGSLATTNPADKLIDLVHALRAPYRANAMWLMNRRTAAMVRKIKTGDGQFLWTDGLSEGQPNRLLGFPAMIDEEMPDPAPGSLSIAFGDFRTGYLIVEKVGVRMLRDPYTSKPSVQFYAYRRVGGALANGEAVKLLRFAA